ncbi:MAG: hypothetical protein V4642_02675 [Bacteroidota bacterium]
MKQLFSIILIFSTVFCYGQDENKDFENLVKLGEIYSKNVNATGEQFKKSVEELRTPALNHIIDALIAIGQDDEKLLTKQFLVKPDAKELKYWYVLREIHYNNQKKDSARPNNIVAKEILEQEIDERWLLDNYYYRIRSGIGKIFNTKDLSGFNFSLDDYGLKDETEKAILFFAITEALAGRFKVLHMMKNYDKLLEFSNKLPKINGRPYYEYTLFSFKDFEWIGYNKIESYKERYIGNLYSVLNGHLAALSEKNQIPEMRVLYTKSVLSIPEYFQYSGGMRKQLQELYNK